MGQALSRKREKALNAGNKGTKEAGGQAPSPTVVAVAPSNATPRKGRRIASIEISRVATNSYREASQHTSDVLDPTKSTISARQVLINPLSEGFATAAAAKLANPSPAASQGPALQHSGSHGARLQTGGAAGGAGGSGSASPRPLAVRPAPASGSGACLSVPLHGAGRCYAANGDAGMYAVISHTSVTTQGGSGLVSGNGVASRHGSGASSGTESSVMVSRRNSAVGCVGAGPAPQRSRLGQAQAQAQAHPSHNTGQGQGQGQAPMPAAPPSPALSPQPPPGPQPAHRWRPQGAAAPAARAATHIMAPGPRLPEPGPSAM